MIFGYCRLSYGWLTNRPQIDTWSICCRASDCKGGPHHYRVNFLALLKSIFLSFWISMYWNPFPSCKNFLSYNFLSSHLGFATSTFIYTVNSNMCRKLKVERDHTNPKRRYKLVPYYLFVCYFCDFIWINDPCNLIGCCSLHANAFFELKLSFPKLPTKVEKKERNFMHLGERQCTKWLWIL